MATANMGFDEDLAVKRLMRFLAIEGITGQEEAIGIEVIRSLREVGVPASAIHYDNCNEKIPLPTQTGNLPPRGTWLRSLGCHQRRADSRLRF